MDDKKADGAEHDKSGVSVDNNSVNNKSDKAGSCLLSLFDQLLILLLLLLLLI